jgi:hypothetical protein
MGDIDACFRRKQLPEAFDFRGGTRQNFYRVSVYETPDTVCRGMPASFAGLSFRTLHRIFSSNLRTY